MVTGFIERTQNLDYIAIVDLPSFRKLVSFNSLSKNYVACISKRHVTNEQ